MTIFATVLLTVSLMIIVPTALSGLDSFDGEIAYGISWNEAQVEINDTEYTVNYALTGATLESIAADESANMIIISIEANEDGLLTIELPRIIIGSSKDGVDRPFIVSLTREGEDDGGQLAKVVESYSVSNDRILDIPLTETTTQIRITGTYLMPEFGPRVLLVSTTVAAIMITTICMLRAKYVKL